MHEDRAVTSFQAVRIVWDRQGLPLPPIPGMRLHALNIGPEPGHPFGKKGAALLAAWRQLSHSADAGMLTIDGDVAADPADIGAMMAAIDEAPRDVHTAPVRLWPSSTTRPDWVWGHWHAEASQDLSACDPPLFFTFSLTYLPRRLIEACDRAGLARWAFPSCDAQVSRTAKTAGIPAHVVYGAAPKHVPYCGYW